LIVSARSADTEVIQNFDGRNVTMNQEDKKPVNITREELYRQVWATPMSRLGMQYGISGNGLKKICVRLNVPYPPRGYWAKLGGGKSVRQMPLPQLLAGTPIQVVITPPRCRRPEDAHRSSIQTLPSACVRQVSKPRNNCTCHPEAAAPDDRGLDH
jgi:hypothetical protein